MEDYIQILLNAIDEHWVDFLGGEYFLQKARKEHAEQSLLETLSESQMDLFLAYEERQNATAVFREEALARQAFLLAKEIYR